MDKEQRDTGKDSRYYIREFYGWMDSLTKALVAAILLLTFAIRTIEVNGVSMEPALHDSQRLLSYTLFYTPQRGDIVAITQPNALDENDHNPIVKRIIAVEGDTVDIDYEKGFVYVNDELQFEPYIAEATYMPGNSVMTNDRAMELPLTVEKGQVFVMGDNRNVSRDSRYVSVGQVDTRYILGKAVFRLWPWDQIGPV